VPRLSIALLVMLLAAACASPTPMAPPEELERYRANSGEPVRSFTHTGQLWGWRSLGDQALAVWTRRDEGYLIEFFDRCQNAAFASSITISNRSGRVLAGTDTITVRRISGGISSSRCRIETIRPIDHTVIQASRRELRDADWTVRDTLEHEQPQ
jgi:hypothetical protein